MPFALGFQDYLESAIVTGGGWVSTLPLSNVQDDDIKTVARSLSLDADDTQFAVDLGALRQVGCIIIGPLNASPDLEYRVRSFSDAAMTLVMYDSTLTAVDVGSSIDWTNTAAWLEWEDDNFWTGIVASDLTELPFYIVRTIPAVDAVDGVARYWKFEFFDANNPDGVLEVGSAMLMRIFRPEFNYAPDSNEAFPDFLTDMTESLGGLRTHWERGIRRKVRLTWPNIDENEAFNSWAVIALKARTSRKVFLIPEETDTGDRLRLRAFPATLTKAPPIAQLNVARASTVLDAEEII